MKIELTRREYRDLLDVLTLADWMLNAYKAEQDPRTARYEKLEQKFLALATQMGYENLVEFLPEFGSYFATREYDETSAAHTFIDEYNEDTFWDELSIRLAYRDLARQLGGYERIANLTPEDRLHRLGMLEAFYNEEFERNGLENLQLRDQARRRKGNGKSH